MLSSCIFKTLDNGQSPKQKTVSVNFCCAVIPLLHFLTPEHQCGITTLHCVIS